MVFAARESERFPAYMRSLIGLIRAAGASLLVTSETTTLGPAQEPLGGIMFLFHNVIQLRYIEMNSDVGRALNIVKMRNSDHDKGIYLLHHHRRRADRRRAPGRGHRHPGLERATDTHPHLLKPEPRQSDAGR